MIPVCYEHNKAIGKVINFKVDEIGIYFYAHIDKNIYENYIMHDIQNLFFSIGFQIYAYERKDQNQRDIYSINIKEISLTKRD
jgi:hypothetical protein